MEEPKTDGFFTPWSATITPDTPVTEAVRRVVAHTARLHPVGRRLTLAYKNLIVGDLSLNLTATKPSE